MTMQPLSKDHRLPGAAPNLRLTINQPKGLGTLKALDAIRSEEIAPYYPGTEPGFLCNRSNRPDCGIITLRDGAAVVGFVATRTKPDTSIKLGPVYIAPAYRGKGLAGMMLALVRTLNPAAYLYMTVPGANLPMQRTAERAGYVFRATLESHYANNRSELVYSLGEPQKTLATEWQLPTASALSSIAELDQKMPELRFSALVRRFPTAIMKRGGGVNLFPNTHRIHRHRIEDTGPNSIRGYYYFLTIQSPQTIGPLLPKTWRAQPIHNKLTIVSRRFVK